MPIRHRVKVTEITSGNSFTATFRTADRAREYAAFVNDSSDAGHAAATLRVDILPPQTRL